MQGEKGIGTGGEGYLKHIANKSVFFSISTPISQRGLTEEMPENAHFCIQKAATHSRSIRSTTLYYQSVAGIESDPSMCPVLCGSLCVLR